jgi:MFS family permease
LAPLRASGFRLLFFSTLASSIGTFLAAVALAIDVKDRTNSGLWVSGVLVVEFLPTVVLGLTLGPLLDRLDRRRLMVGADLVRVATFVALTFATSAGEIVALAAVAGIANGFFRPAVYAGVPNLVSAEELPSANGLLQTIENVSWAAGPILGGLLTAAYSPDAAYWINAVSFVVSAVLVARIPSRLLQSTTALSRGHWTDLKDGFTASLQLRPVRTVVVAWSIAALGTGAITVSEVFLAKNTFDAGDFGYGLLYGAIGTGLVIGGLLSSTLIARAGVARTYSLALLGMAVGFGGAAVSIGVWMAAAFCVAAGVGNGLAVVCNALLIQRGAPDEVRGRAMTFAMSVTFGVMGLSMVLAGALMPPDGARWVWAAGALCLALAAGVAYALARPAVATPRPAEATAN